MAQKVNYQRLLDQILLGLEESAAIKGKSEIVEIADVAEIAEMSESKKRKPRILLHSCCAPCSSAVIEYLARYFRITLFFYNPNISTEEEFDFRASELKRLLGEMAVPDTEARIVPYDHEEFLEAARGLEAEPERGARCRRCFELRLRRTAEEGARATFREKGDKYDYFCTTLSISPLKNAEVLNELGKSIGEQCGIPFLPSDFKKKGGYQRSLELSREHKLYRQNFCGCEFSMPEAMK